MDIARFFIPYIAGKNYFQRVLSIPGLIAFHPMADTGATIQDISQNALHGAFAGTITSKGTDWLGGHYADLSTTAFLNLYSANFLTKFNPAEFTISAMLMPNDWVTGAQRYYFQFLADANNIIKLYTDELGTTYFYNKSGGTAINKYIDANCLSVTKFTTLTMTFSKTNDRMRAYLNAGLLDTSSSLGTWVGDIATGTCGFGSYRSLADIFGASGKYSNLQIFNRELTADEVQKLQIAPTPVLSILGDSISIYNSSSSPFLGIATERGYKVKNHAVTGMGIINGASNMDVQTAACIGDNAQNIIIALGTNDDNAGNMTTLQAEAEENIAELKVSNPGATLYWMNVLPCWTDVGGGTEVAKGNIRTAIAAACISQGITCWDTYTTPWIASSETKDGLHPNVVGAGKIKTEILARI